MAEQLLYLTTFMSSACRLLNKIRSCKSKQIGINFTLCKSVDEISHFVIVLDS